MPSNTTNTPFSNKCEILGRLWLFYSDQAQENEGWRDFFEWANIGLPLSYMIWQDLANAKVEGKKIVEDTWVTFCGVINIDPNGKYADLNDAWNASPNPPIQ